MLENLRADLKEKSSAEKAKASAWFFKTGPGQYGEGDKFIGVTVPEQRAISRKYKDLNFKEIETLLHSPIHEERLVALFILVLKFKKASEEGRQEIYDFYLANKSYINNWDLVDSSASYIVGAYLNDKPKEILKVLARSKNLWDRRIAIISTAYFINQNNPQPTLELTSILLKDKEDLIHKAVGWMLREVGKRCSVEILENFLLENSKIMPRTMLRYAIEHFPPEKRLKFLARD